MTWNIDVKLAQEITKTGFIFGLPPFFSYVEQKKIAILTSESGKVIGFSSCPTKHDGVLSAFTSIFVKTNDHELPSIDFQICSTLNPFRSTYPENVSVVCLMNEVIERRKTLQDFLSKMLYSKNKRQIGGTLGDEWPKNHIAIEGLPCDAIGSWLFGYLDEDRDLKIPYSDGIIAGLIVNDSILIRDAYCHHNFPWNGRIIEL